MRTLHLFAGAGGGIIADMLLGHIPVGAVEIDPFCRQVLQARQDEGWLPRFPIYEDVKQFDGTDFRGQVDCVSGGFPCQDISACGNGVGITGERSGLFFELSRICRNIRPEFIFLENSPCLVSRGLDAVLGELASMRYDAEWLCLPASAVGAWHRRDRWWCLARERERERERERTLPTPTARDRWSSGQSDLKRHSPKLSTVVRYPTPTTTGLYGGTGSSLILDQLEENGVITKTERNEISRGWTGSHLNPAWVEWLMAWPIGWTAFERLETVRCPLAPPQHS